MALNTLFISSVVTTNTHNISKYSAYKSPEYQQNYYSLEISGSIGNNINTQSAEIILSILESMNSSTPNTIIFLLQLHVPVIRQAPFIFLAVYDDSNSTININVDNYYGKIVFLSNSKATFELTSGDGTKIFLSNLVKYN